MSLTITALIVTPDGKAVAQTDAQVCIFDAAGAPKVIATGRTDAAGKLAIGTRYVVSADYQPRLQLQLLRGETFVEASEDPFSFTGSTCDFGKVTFIAASASAPIRAEADMESFAPLTPIVPIGGEPIVPGDGADARQALIDQLNQQHALALATRTGELQAERTAALAALTQQHAKALATRTGELQAEKTAALAALAQQHAKALATRTGELQAEKTAALAALAQQSELARAAALAAAEQQHAAALAAKEAELEALGERPEGPHETSIEELAQATASQLQRVQRTLREDQAGLRLGAVSLQLKVLPGRTGGRVALPQRQDIEKVGAGALGSLDLAFVPEAAPTASRQALTVPRVLGYTEALARRKLGERRLGVEVIHQLVTRAADHGRVVLQRPLPDVAVAEGTSILIAIGRQDEHDPRPT